MFYALLISLIANASVVSAAIFNHKSNKRKANAEADITEANVNLKELSATEKIIEIYNKLNVDLKNDYDRRLNICISEIKEMKSQMNVMKLNQCAIKDCPNRI